MYVFQPDLPGIVFVGDPPSVGLISAAWATEHTHIKVDEVLKVRVDAVTHVVLLGGEDVLAYFLS